MSRAPCDVVRSCALTELMGSSSVSPAKKKRSSRLNTPVKEAGKLCQFYDKTEHNSTCPSGEIKVCCIKFFHAFQKYVGDVTTERTRGIFKEKAPDRSWVCPGRKRNHTNVDISKPQMSRLAVEPWWGGPSRVYS